MDTTERFDVASGWDVESDAFAYRIASVFGVKPLSIGFDPGVPVRMAHPAFKFGDVIRYRSSIPDDERYMVLTTDHGDLIDLMDVFTGQVWHDRKDPSMWEIAE